MTAAGSRQTGQAPSRLVQLLAPSGSSATTEQLPCVAERLGRFYGLKDTMSLDAAIAYRQQQSGMDQGPVFHRLTEELATLRRALIGKINGYGDDDAEPITAWLKLQCKLAATSDQLRDKVRQAMKDHNQNLARLAALDAVFDHTMAGYTSQCFSQTPKVLEQRLQALQTASEQTRPIDERPRFYRDAQHLLLAELDLRLEPVLGLLEACHNEVSHTP